MKKFSVFLFSFFLIMISLFSITFFDYNSNKTKALGELEINSKSAYLIDYNTKTVVYKKNELERKPIASMCKIMTLLLTFEHISNNNVELTQPIFISKNASGMGGSQVFLEDNCEYSLDQLIKSIVVASANDASVAVAEWIAGSENNFVGLMNDKAKTLGMNNTNFVNCTGLPKDGQYSCAKDVAIMFGELLKFDNYYNYSTIWMDNIIHPQNRITSISNTNKLVKFYQGCDSGKTGYTSEAGHCLASSAIRNNTRLISVVINAPNSKARFKDSSTLFDYGFNNFESRVVLNNNEPLDLKLNVIGGKEKYISVIPQNSISIFSKKNEKSNYNLHFNLNKDIKAPILSGDVVGEVILLKDGIQIASTSVVALNNVDKLSYFDSILSVGENWLIG